MVLRELRGKGYSLPDRIQSEDDSVEHAVPMGELTRSNEELVCIVTHYC